MRIFLSSGFRKKSFVFYMECIQKSDIPFSFATKFSARTSEYVSSARITPILIKNLFNKFSYCVIIEECDLQVQETKIWTAAF